MLVKICGIQTIEAGTTAVEAGADFIGFVFAPSSRRLSPFQAAGIAHSLPSSVKKVGVFVNEQVETILTIAETVKLDYIQLHGDEAAEIAEVLPYPIIKAFSIDEAIHEQIDQYPCDYYLIDSPARKYRGGSGKTFDWEKMLTLPIDRKKILLAGGLTAENIQEAIEVVKPAGVDVSSGVETDGVKDNTKIRQFLSLAKA
ncbi:phosphoribosylanthranilate isomerase [Virgibacillus sp. W0181]|uniref:phosphoribosylanthranilate isomerase n=1 Tax=Virgibacillus sp. W0181 TaxID=3391581 RepID=UPI003F4854EC